LIGDVLRSSAAGFRSLARSLQGGAIVRAGRSSKNYSSDVSHHQMMTHAAPNGRLVTNPFSTIIMKALVLLPLS